MCPGIHHILQNLLLIHTLVDFHSFINEYERARAIKGHSRSDHQCRRMTASRHSSSIGVCRGDVQCQDLHILLVEFLLDGEQFLVQKKDRLVLASLEPAEQRFALGYPRWGITKKLVLAALLTGSEPP